MGVIIIFKKFNKPTPKITVRRMASLTLFLSANFGFLPVVVRIGMPSFLKIESITNDPQIKSLI